MKIVLTAKILNTTLLLILASFTSELAAQPAEPERAASAPESKAENRGRVLYIDAPQPVRDDRDVVFPEPALFVNQPATEALMAERVEAIENYSSRVAEIESLGGAWDLELTEELTALGRLQQQLGDHRAAITTLTRAMHVSRVNAGLHSLQQVPVVEAMIQSFGELGDWGQVDKYQNYMYFVQRRAYGHEDPRMIPALERLGRWNLEAFSLGFGEPLGGRLSTAQLMFRAATQMVGMHFGRKDERYQTYLRDVARSAYLVSLYPEYMAELSRPEYRSSEDKLRDTLFEFGTPSARGYMAGSQALEEIVAFHEEEGDSPYLLAEAITNLADWELIYERRNAAEELYGRAWTILAEQDDSEELFQRLFGQVVAIPSFVELPVNLLLGSSSSRRPRLNADYVDVRLDVTDYGAPRNLVVLTEQTEANADQLSRVRREIRQTVFRPLIVDGVPQDSRGHRFRYRYWY